MPELPEVETVVRGLAKCLPGLKIERVEVLHPRPLGGTSPQAFNDFFAGRSFEKISRFGKYLWFMLDNKSSMVAHLRMTGKFIFQERQDYPHDHIRVIFFLSGGARLYFKDVRLFGTLKIYPPGAVILEWEKLGVDPVLEKLTAEYLLDKARGRKIPVKTFLLDQSVMAGLGNIYASEILFSARISPFIPVLKISRKQWERIVEFTEEILARAILHNGTSISDFRNVDDKTGEFQKMLMVYQRGGQICRVCGKTVIEKAVQGQRSTFYCPLCQGE